MKKIYFVRHGECELNILKFFAGHTESPLTELGGEQALQAAKDILKNKLKIDKIISSTLWRASESAVIIAETIGYPPADITTNDLFIERDFGILEGTPRSEFFEVYTYQDVDNVAGVEKLESLNQRAQNAYDYIKSIEHEHILVVSHSAFFRAFSRAVTGRNDFNNEYTNPFTTIKNGTVYTLL